MDYRINVLGAFKPRGRDGVETQLGFQKPVDLEKELFGRYLYGMLYQKKSYM